MPAIIIFCFLLLFGIQARMAEIFMNIFGDKLATENLVELNNLDRLPSPHQLQGKVLLKGTESSVVKPPRTLSVRRSIIILYRFIYL